MTRRSTMCPVSWTRREPRRCSPCATPSSPPCSGRRSSTCARRAPGSRRRATRRGAGSRATSRAERSGSSPTCGDELERAARTAATADLRASLAELACEAGQTLDSVRATAQGIYPARLADDGIAKALVAELAGSRAVVVREAAGTARRPQDQEAAIFFSCLEAVQNAIKHAGPGTRMTISLEPAAGGGIAFAVRDEGTASTSSERATGRAWPTSATGSKRSAAMCGSRPLPVGARPSPEP